MLILLPPSESKARPADGAVFDPDDVASELRSTVRRVRVALGKWCRRDPDDALAGLGLSDRQATWLTLNASLLRQPCAPAIDLYDGVLFQALDHADLPAEARNWLDAHVGIASALFGLVTPDQPIPPYRLSGTTRIPGLPNLPDLWQKPLTRYLTRRDPELIVDMRSGAYERLWQPKRSPASARSPANARGLADATVRVKVWHRDAGGAKVATSHANKAVKGKLVRDLARHRIEASQAEDFVAALRDLAWDVTLRDGQIDVVTEPGGTATDD